MRDFQQGFDKVKLRVRDNQKVVVVDKNKTFKG